MRTDTIFALASGRLPAAIAVVRLSGPQTRFALETIGGKSVEARRLHFRSLRDQAGSLIDQCLVVLFPGPHSETGEDCGEVHLHGGKAVLAVLFEQLTVLGLRPAEPGEFSKRAFLNGKIDLVQAEAIADLVGAETEAQRRLAAAGLEGRQSSLYAAWRKRLLHARAMIEAELDFDDEGDVPGSVSETIWNDMRALHTEIIQHIAGFGRALILRDGFEVVILGAPNAGKSSLLNALAQRDVAIVSDEAGTTRDLVEARLDLDGVKVIMVDTAGLRAEAGSRIERIGIERARERAGEADLIVHLVDLASPETFSGLQTSVPVLRVGNKVDLIAQPIPNGDYEILLSATSGEGVDKLLELISAHARNAVGRIGEALPSRGRHLFHLSTASDHIQTAMNQASPLELRAEELRMAGAALGHITGDIGTEEMLGAIFSRFCIGK